MRPWRRTIFAHLFLVFSAIVLTSISVFAGINYVTVNDRLSTQAVNGLLSLSRSLVSNLDAHLQNMNRINMVPLSSPVLQRQVNRALNTGDGATVLDLMASINGLTQAVRQFNIYSLDGRVLGVGYRNAITTATPLDLPWYQAAVMAQGDRVIVGPHYDFSIASVGSPDRTRQYISLCRYFAGVVPGRPWLVEVEEDCSELFRELDIVSNDPHLGRRFLVIEGDKLIYPSHGTIPDLDWILANRPTDVEVPVSVSRHPGDGHSAVLAFTHSLEANWNLVVIQNEESLYPELADLALQIALSALVLACAALVGSFWVARRVSSPIRRLRDEMTGFSLDPIPENHRVLHQKSEGLVELDGLVQDFDHLQEELRSSFAEAVLLRTHKHRAQLLALQAQMHPHFMFNMLATIGAMAEEASVNPISAVVNDLSEMMRSIASSEDDGHRLRDEFDFVERYLRCLKIRFGNDLWFQAECGPEVSNLLVPRLILHPFVENAIKHATKRRPPWKVTINALQDKEFWWISVEDSGAGFDPLALERLRADFRRIRGRVPDLDDLPDLHVEGLGLLNTFIRLRLSYGNDVTIELDNLAEGGARVRIGGRIHG